MNHRYLTAALLAIVASNIEAQKEPQSPRLLVNITIDQLTTECIEAYHSYFGTNGFKQLMEQGVVYQNITYPFEPTDRSSAIASLMTGTTPYYNGIIANRWLNKKTLQQMGCTDDPSCDGIYTTDKASATHLQTSTITDELKIATEGKAIVYGIAKQKDAAILSAGHAADGALWKDSYNGQWCSTNYYLKKIPEWLTEFNATSSETKKSTEFQQITELTNLAVLCIEKTGMGTDNVCDMLNITLDASTPITKKSTNWQSDQTQTYINLDRQLADLIATIQSKVGEPNVVFFITSTGHVEEPQPQQNYRIPTGNVYINRVASLLNMYLGALHGSDKYVEGCTRNQIYLNHDLLEKKRFRLSDILNESQAFLLQCDGIRKAHTLESLLISGQTDLSKKRGGMNAANGGDISVEIAPGWQLINEETHEHFLCDARPVKFPLIIFQAGIRPQKILTPVTTDRIAPTIANTIHIRAPNACTANALY